MGLFRLFLGLTVAWISCSELLLCSFKGLTNYLVIRTKPKQPKSFLEKLKGGEYFNLFKNQEKQTKKMPENIPFINLVQWLRDTSDELRFAWSNSLRTRQIAQKSIKDAYNFVPHSDLILTAMGTLSIAWLLRRSLHRYKNANDLPLSFFEGKRQKKLKGIAVSVNDSDNIRFYHQPHFYSLFRPNLSRQDLKYHTINIRLAGIDAPEMAHFGTKSQPFAVEAKEWLTKFVQGRKVCIQLHRIDQYGRAVATVWVHRRKFPWLWPVWWNVSLEMVRAGYATIYRDLGAEYGGILKDLESAETRARKSKIGMWSQSKEEYQSPGDFKRQNRLQAALLKSSQEDLKMNKIDFISELKSVAVGR